MKALLIALLALSLNGCFWFTKKEEPVKVETRVEHVKIFHPALPAKISLPWNDKKWKAITPEILEKWVKDWQDGTVTEPLVGYFISTEDYTLLADNIAKIKKLAKDQKLIIIYYRSIDADKK